MEDIKFVDIIGNEVKPGEFVANAVKYIDSGVLRKCLFRGVSEIPNPYWWDEKNKDRKYFKAVFKSFIIDTYRWGDNNGMQYVTSGNSSTLLEISPDQTIYKLKVVRLGTLEQTFTPEEIKIIQMSKFKLN